MLFGLGYNEAEPGDAIWIGQEWILADGTEIHPRTTPFPKYGQGGSTGTAAPPAPGTAPD
jgi:hypothetical protein